MSTDRMWIGHPCTECHRPALRDRLRALCDGSVWVYLCAPCYARELGVRW